MSMRCLFFVLLLAIIGCQQSSNGQEKLVSAERAGIELNNLPVEAGLDKQLEINRDALLKGPSEEIRIKAAVVMLYSENPLARKILLDALRPGENAAARAAVCRALIQTGASQKPVVNKQEFIQPLFEILTTDDSIRAKLAAETMLIFEYEQIQEYLENIATDVSLPVNARLNAVYALKLQPDIRATLVLMGLLDDSEEQLAIAARTAIYSLGIPVSETEAARQEIINELKQQGLEAFLRNRLIRREAEIRKLATELQLWRQRYRLALDRVYDAMNDDTAKGILLTEHLRDSEPTAKLWALEKVAQRRRGTNPTRLPIELGPLLLNLISDSDREVRLNTARLLAVMGELNSASHLAEQLKVEQDDEVKMELFDALGRACYYASLPDSKFKITKDIRKQALDWAEKYLSEQKPDNVQKGAEVMRRLLEQNELTSAEVDIYFNLLEETFKKHANSTNETLRGVLLNAMAGLCAPQSVHNTQAKKRFKPLFEEALSNKTDDLAREAAVDGLIYIDKADALKRLRKDFINDTSTIIRKKLIDLAGEAGTKEDLVWLTEKLGSNAESEQAWLAMLKIFNNSDAKVLEEWIEKLVSKSSQIKLSDEQKISFLKIAERKATAENEPELLKNIRLRLAGLYIAIGQFEQAAENLGFLHKAVRAEQEKEAIVAQLIDVYLRWSKLDLASNLVENCLLNKDLDPNSLVVSSIDNYLRNPTQVADPNDVLKALIEIKTLEARPKWREQLKLWNENLGKTENKEKPRNNSG